MIAIDLGSNTLRVIEYDGAVFGKSFEKIVRTAQGLGESGRIGLLAQDRIINALQEAQKLIDFQGQEVVAVTTAAVRMASNAVSFLEEVKHRTGVEFRIIDGEKEGQLTLLAVQHRLSLLNRDTSELILVDIGGGSTEIVVVSQGKIVSKSFDVGIVTLCEKTSNLFEVQSELDLFRAMIFQHFGEFLTKPTVLALTAGTPTTIVAYKLGMNYETYDPVKVNGEVLKRDDCRIVLNELLSMSQEERAHFVGVGREELIIVGIRMVEVIFECLGFDEGIVVDDGLREGVALNHYLHTKTN
jgi:exopolyphosphatase/guanosine-5'-triphosphate,3'-diphosphate pyrophosphatase